MRVCMVTTSFPRWEGDFSGGFVESLSKSLVRQGVEVSVVAPGHEGARPHEDMGGVTVHRYSYAAPARLEVLAYDGGIPHRLKTSVLARLELPPFLAAMYALTCRVAQHCDLIHAHWIPTGLVAGLAGRRLAIPMVLTTHGSDGSWLRRGGLRKKMSLLSVGLASHTIAVSEALRGDVLLSGVEPQKVSTIHNGVDLGAFQPSSMEHPGRIIVWAGRMTEEKGLEYLIRAMGEVSEVHPDASLLLVGDGPSRRALEKLSEELGLSGSIRFAGEKDRSKMPEVYAGCDLVALPSLREGLGMVILEAMAAGKPVVASKVGGIPELITHGKNGLLVPPGSRDELARAVTALLDSPSLMAEMGSLSRKLVESTHSWESAASKVKAVYDRVSANVKM